MKYQDDSGNIINEYLQSNIQEDTVMNKLSSMYLESFN